MSDTIDRLDIAIEAQAKSANSQIENLISKLSRLQSALGGISGGGLNQLASGVQKLGSAMQTMNNVKTTDFTRLAKGIEKLGTINTASLSGVANSMNSISRAFSGMSAISSNTIAIGELSKNISKLGNKSTQSAITNIPALATSIKQLMTTLSTAPSVNKNIINMTNALANLSQQGSKTGNALKGIKSGLNSYSNGTAKATKSTRSLATSFGLLYGKVYLVRKAFQALNSSIGTSMDFLEISNYFEVAMRKVASDSAGQWKDNGYNSAEEYVNSFSERMKSLASKMTGYQVDLDGNATMSGNKNLGMNPDKVMQYQATYAQMSDSLGMIGETALNTSKALTMLGTDWASLRNLSFDTAWEKFASALAGQTRAVRSLGLDITMATLQEYAYKYGLNQAVASMNQATKSQLRLLTILDQSEVAFGDLANTISSPANQLRILKENFTNLARTIGNIFLPVVSAVLPYINAMVVALQRLFSWFGSLLGIKFNSINSSTGGMSDSISDLVDSTDSETDSLDSANSAAKKLKTTLLDIDELNVKDADDSSSSGTGTSGTGGGSPILDTAIGDAVAEYEKVWDEAFDRMDDKISRFADAIEAYFRKMYDAAEPFRNAIKKLWDEGLSKLANFTFTALKDFYNELLVPLAEWAFGTENMGLTRLVDVLNNLLNKVNWSELNRSLKEFWIAIEPYAEQFGEGLIDFFEDIGNLAVNVINKFPFLLDGITTALEHGNPEDARDFGYALGVLGASLLTIKTAMAGAKWIEKLGSLKDLFSNAGWTVAFVEMFQKAGDAVENSEKLEDLTSHMPKREDFETTQEYSQALSDYRSELEEFSKINLDNTGIENFLSGLGVKIKRNSNGTIEPIGSWIEGLEEWKKKGTEIRESEGKGYDSFWENVKSTFSTKWGEIVSWWDSSGIKKWFDDTIAPIFEVSTWTGLWDNVKTAFSIKWQEIVDWWVNSAFCIWWNDNVAPWFSFETWYLLLQGMQDGIKTKWDETVGAWITDIQLWWDTHVAPWFDFNTWLKLVDGMKKGIVAKWTETVTLWKTNITTWWDTNVAPWFTMDRWSKLLESIPTAFKNAFKDAANGAIGFLNGVIDGVESLINNAIEGLKKLAKAASKIPGVSISFDVSPISLPKIPTFQTGGFPEDGLFMANHNELVGQFANGQTAVANNSQIVSGISAGVENANQSVVNVLRDVVQLLDSINQKDTSTYIGDREIALASRRGSKSLGATILI